MLYDILFIDDDFDKQSDSKIEGIDAQNLFLELIRDNLRVTYTTGELDDLEKLTEKDLSCVKYIFCDLHLVGIKGDDSYKIINSKLITIFEKLLKKIDSSIVTIFINSKYIAKYGDEGESDLDKKIKSVNLLTNRCIEIYDIEEKNSLNEDDREKLLKNNLEIHMRSSIITKALDVEKTFNEKLKIDKRFVDVIPFENKFKKLEENFNLEKDTKIQTQLLQQIRNKVAHTNNALEEIKGRSGERKKFWEVMGKKDGCNNAIDFENFAALMKYINSIGHLVETINKAKEKPLNT